MPTRKKAPGADARIVEDALSGDRASLERLVERLTPVIRARVVRALHRDGRARTSGTFPQVVKDLVQQVYVDLFERDGRVLRNWDQMRGLSLENYVGLVAERRVCSTLRRTRQNPWTEEPTDGPAFEGATPTPSPEREAGARERLQHMLTALRAELSPRGWQVFTLLFLHDASIEEAGRRTGLERDAIYAWRSRLRKLARRLAREIDQQPGKRAVR